MMAAKKKKKKKSGNGPVDTSLYMTEKQARAYEAKKKATKGYKAPPVKAVRLIAKTIPVAQIRALKAHVARTNAVTNSLSRSGAAAIARAGGAAAGGMDCSSGKCVYVPRGSR